MTTWERIGPTLGTADGDSGVLCSQQIHLSVGAISFNDVQYEVKGPKHSETLNGDFVSVDKSFPVASMELLGVILGTCRPFFRCSTSQQHEFPSFSPHVEDLRQHRSTAFLVLLNGRHWCVLRLRVLSDSKLCLQIFSTTNLLLEFDLNGCRKQFSCCLHLIDAFVSAIQQCSFEHAITDAHELLHHADYIQTLQYGNQGCGIASSIILALLHSSPHVPITNTHGVDDLEELITRAIVAPTDVVRVDSGYDCMFLCTSPDGEQSFHHKSCLDFQWIQPFLAAQMMLMQLSECHPQLQTLLDLPVEYQVQLLDYGASQSVCSSSGGPPIDRSIRIWSGYEFCLRVLLRQRSEITSLFVFCFKSDSIRSFICITCSDQGGGERS